MHGRPTNSPNEEYKSHVYTALEAAMQIQKRKVVVGPNDAVGILLFNTVRFTSLSTDNRFMSEQSRKNEKIERGTTEYKSGTYLFQPMGQINAPTIKELIQLLNGALRCHLESVNVLLNQIHTETEAKARPDYLRYEFPPTEKRVPMGDVFTSCNWALRDG